MTHDNIKAAIKASIEATPPEQLRFLTLTSLKNMAGKNADSGIVMHVVSELVEDKTLMQHGLFFDDAGVEWEIKDADLPDVLATNEFVHPETGETIKTKVVLLYYSAKD